MYSLGNAYLQSQFPKLTFIQDAVIREESNGGMSVLVAITIVIASLGAISAVVFLFARYRRYPSPPLVSPQEYKEGFVKL